MMNAQQAKWLNAMPPEAIHDNASVTTVAVDTLGFAQASFVVALGATDIAVTALKVQESDDNSSYSDVTGLIFGTSADIAGATSSLPAATDDNKIYIMQARTGGSRKRYMKVICTFGDGTVGGFASCVCMLSGGQIQGHDATSVGAAQILSV